MEITEDTPVTPHTFFMAATGFYQASAGLLDRPFDGGRYHWPALCLNLCFCFELGLKCFLLAKGWDEDGVKGFGHKLTDLLDAAEQNGFVSSHEDVRDLIEKLSPMHGKAPFPIRYLRHMHYQVPVEEQAVAIGAVFMGDLGHALNKELGLGLPPKG